MLSKISISDLVETKGFEASLITTFNASLPFYEEVLLRRLRANGCRHNVVLMDSAQCSTSWESEITRPRQAGFEYSLLPIRSARAFHPKVAFFAGPKKAALVVGSHNITVAGLGFNREISNLIEVQNKQLDCGDVMFDAWKSVTTWLEDARAYSPPEIINSALRVENYLKPVLAVAGRTSDSRFLSQSERLQSLFEQVRQHVTFAVKRILVTGAFFDQQLAFLKALRAWCPEAEIIVGIDPDTVLLPALNKEIRVRFVDARAAWPGEDSKYLHAKALFIEGLSRSVFLSGSANPSAPGWGTSTNAMNTEAMILLQDLTALAAMETTGLSLLFDFPPIGHAELEKTVARSSDIAKIEKSTGLKILVGTVDYDSRTITVELSSASKIIAAKPLDEWDGNLSVTPTLEATENVLRIGFPEHLPTVRSLILLSETEAVARVLVHHSRVIDAHLASNRQHVIRAALGDIGATETDIASVIEQVQQVIFAPEAAGHVAFKRSSAANKSSTDATRPETLAADDSEFGQNKKKKRRLIRSGDLGYLIDTLIRFLHIPQTSDTHHVAEPVSLDDEETQAPEGATEAPALEDPAIADAIVRKSRVLIRKMIEREKLAASEQDMTPIMIVQLVAVLAVLKELRHLERQGRWRNSGLKLIDSKAIETLFQKSMYYLFSSSHRLWALVESDGEEHFEELDTLNVLLAWLAWEVGHTFTLALPTVWEAKKEDLDWRLAGNGYMARLLPRVSVESQWELLETSIQRTIRQVPKDKKESDEWLQLNATCSDALLDEFTTEGQGERRVSVGGFGYVPRIIDPWSVVLDVYDGKVALWDFDFKAGGGLESRRFLQTSVITARPIVN